MPNGTPPGPKGKLLRIVSGKEDVDMLLWFIELGQHEKIKAKSLTRCCQPSVAQLMAEGMFYLI